MAQALAPLPGPQGPAPGRGRGAPHPCSTWTSTSSPGAGSWPGGGSGRRGFETRSCSSPRPCARAQPTPGKLSGGRGAATSPARPVGPARPCPRLRAPLRPGAAAPPARSQPGGDVAGPAVAHRSQEAPPAEVPPQAHSGASLRGGRGGLARLGASGPGPPPAAQSLCAREGPATSRTSDVRSRDSASPPQNPGSSLT